MNHKKTVVAKQAADSIEFKARGISRHARNYFKMAHNGTKNPSGKRKDC